MRQIICFGDSNTFGHFPHPGKERYDKNERWPGILAELLGPEYEVVEEGLNGRTTDLDDPEEEGRNGKVGLERILKDYPAPDLMIMMLGTNDQKWFFHRTTEEIAEAAGKLVARMKEVYPKETKILLAAPVLIPEDIMKGEFAEMFGPAAAGASLRFAKTYKEQAEKYGVDYMNAADYAGVSDGDYLHLDYEDHRKLAEGFCKKIQDEIYAI